MCSLADARLLPNHSCTSVQAQGWGGIKNGELLQRAEVEFDLFITSDQNIRYQQSLDGRMLAILEPSTNDLRRIEAASALIQEALENIGFADFQYLDVP